MPNYLLAITPEPIADSDYSEAFCSLIGCNNAYDGIGWNGVITFAKCQVGGLWTSLIQMNDEAVPDNQTLTVVWSPDPLNDLRDPNRLAYLMHRTAIISIVDDWATEIDSIRGDALFFNGDVCWILDNAKTDLLTSDFANNRRSRFKLIDGSRNVTDANNK